MELRWPLYASIGTLWDGIVHLVKYPIEGTFKSNLKALNSNIYIVISVDSLPRIFLLNNLETSHEILWSFGA